MTPLPPNRADHEITHGRTLLESDPELVWGWKSPAGKLRAQRRGQLVARGASIRAGQSVLEIGCGTGMFTEVFAQSGAHLIAVDVSGELLTRARERGLPASQVQFIEKRFEDCDVDGPFDAVIGSSVLHHLDLAAALAKIFALLKPGGQMSFAEPNMLNPQVFAERNFRFFKSVFWYLSPDETAFVRWQLAGQLSHVGFTDIAIKPFDWLHPATPSALIGAAEAAGRVLEAVPMVREFSGSLHISCRRPA